MKTFSEADHKKRVFNMNSVDQLNLQKVLNFITQIHKKDSIQNGDLLFVGNHEDTKVLAKLVAFKTNQSFVAGSWKPGTISNWNETTKRIDALHRQKKILFKNLQAFEKINSNKSRHIPYKNYEEYNKKKLKWGGLQQSVYEPRLVIFLDEAENYVAIREAQKRLIPTVRITSLANTNTNGITYNIFVKDGSIHTKMNTVNLLVDHITNL
jgi:ribosomal protein S2